MGHASQAAEKGLIGTASFGRGSVSCCKQVISILSRAREQAVSDLFPQAVQLVSFEANDAIFSQPR